MSLNVAPVARADLSPPIVQAQHAFVGDPLFDLDSPQGMVYGINPDERTPMASTTKIVTLHIAVDFILGRRQSSYFTNLFDEVTISPFAAGIGGSSMKDVNGVPLQAGEKVRFDNLLRGMMYPSGNNAAYAVAEHLAGNWQTFVEVMNEETLPGEVSPQGLPNTHFVNPNGFDDPNHYTTARELAKIWMHAFQDDYFRQVVGFTGTYSFSTQLPDGTTKQYSYCWGPQPVGCFGSLYPTIGWEGVKGGSTPGCGTTSTNSIGCVVLSAHRIGRQLVVAFMQGVDSADIFKLLDYGFAKVFHPDLQDTALSLGPWLRHDLQCLPNGRAVSAGISGNFGVRMTTWAVDADGSQITKLGENTGTTVQSSQTQLPLRVDVKAVALSNSEVVTGRTIGGPILLGGSGSRAGSITLSLWSISNSGFPSVVVKDVPGGVGSSLQLLRVDQHHFVTAYVNPSAGLVLKYWDEIVKPSPIRGGSPTFEIDNLSTFTLDSVSVDEVAISTLGSFGFVTATRVGVGFVWNQVWHLDTLTGAIQTVSSVNLGGFTGSMVSIIQIPVQTFPDEIPTWAYFATAFRSDTGFMRIMYTRADFDLSGSLLNYTLVGDSGPSDFLSGTPAMAPLASSGLVVAIRDGNGNQKLVVWESRRNADDSISPFRVAEHEGAEANSVALCGLPHANSEGNFASASLVPTGLCGGCLKVQAWRVGSRP